MHWGAEAGLSSLVLVDEWWAGVAGRVGLDTK